MSLPRGGSGGSGVPGTVRNHCAEGMKLRSAYTVRAHTLERGMVGLAALSCSLAPAAGCSSDDSTGAGGATSNSATSSSATSGNGGAGGGPATPKNSCAQPGDKGNSKGVGEYCTPGGQQCTAFPEAGTCLADVGQDQWFCTHIFCTMDSECGEGASCFMTGMGSACVPDKCGAMGTGGAGGGSGGAGGAGGTG